MAMSVSSGTTFFSMKLQSAICPQSRTTGRNHVNRILLFRTRGSTDDGHTSNLWRLLTHTKPLTTSSTPQQASLLPANHYPYYQHQQQLFTMTSSFFDPQELVAVHWDGKDVDAFVGAFAPGAEWTVNTAPPSTAIRDLTTALMGTTKSSRHHDLQVISNADKTDYVLHGAVEYELEGKAEKVICRLSDVFQLNDKAKIVKCWTYMDVAPLSA